MNKENAEVKEVAEIDRINVKDLEAGLEEMTGYDYEACERLARQKDPSIPMMVVSSIFHTVVAARILKVSTAEIEMLPIKKYMAITTAVSRFLLAGLEGSASLQAE